MLLFQAEVYSSHVTTLLLKMYLGQNLRTNSHHHRPASFSCGSHLIPPVKFGLIHIHTNTSQGAGEKKKTKPNKLKSCLALNQLNFRRLVFHEKETIQGWMT